MATPSSAALVTKITTNIPDLHSRAQSLTQPFDREIADLFATVDQDGSGELSKGELFSFLRAYKKALAKELARDPEAIEGASPPLLLDKTRWEGLFALVDGDGSGCISLDEFRVFVLLSFLLRCDICRRMVTDVDVWSCPREDYDECLSCNLKIKAGEIPKGRVGRGKLQLMPLTERAEPEKKVIKAWMKHMLQVARKARGPQQGESRVDWGQAMGVLCKALETAKTGLELANTISGN